MTIRELYEIAECKGLLDKEIEVTYKNESWDGSINDECYCGNIEIKENEEYVSLDLSDSIFKYTCD